MYALSGLDAFHDKWEKQGCASVCRSLQVQEYPAAQQYGGDASPGT